jgi:hypothetical protein
MFSWNISISIMTGYGQDDWDSKPNRRKGVLSAPSTAFYLWVPAAEKWEMYLRSPCMSSWCCSFTEGTL